MFSSPSHSSKDIAIPQERVKGSKEWLLDFLKPCTRWVGGFFFFPWNIFLLFENRRTLIFLLLKLLGDQSCHFLKLSSGFPPHSGQMMKSLPWPARPYIIWSLAIPVTSSNFSHSVFHSLSCSHSNFFAVNWVHSGLMALHLLFPLPKMLFP